MSDLNLNFGALVADELVSTEGFKFVLLGQLVPGTIAYDDNAIQAGIGALVMVDDLHAVWYIVGPL